MRVVPDGAQEQVHVHAGCLRGGERRRVGRHVAEDRVEEQRPHQHPGRPVHVPAGGEQALLARALQVAAQPARNRLRHLARERRHLGVGHALAEGGADQAPEAGEMRVGRLGPRQELGSHVARLVRQRGDELAPGVPVHGLTNECVLRAKLSKKRHLVHAGHLGDPPRGGAARAVFGDHPDGGRQELFPDFHWIFTDVQASACLPRYQTSATDRWFQPLPECKTKAGAPSGRAQQRVDPRQHVLGRPGDGQVDDGRGRGRVGVDLDGEGAP